MVASGAQEIKNEEMLMRFSTLSHKKGLSVQINKKKAMLTYMYLPT